MLNNPHVKLRELIEFIDQSLADHAWLHSAVRSPLSNPPRYLSPAVETRPRLTETCAPGLEALGYDDTMKKA